MVCECVCVCVYKEPDEDKGKRTLTLNQINSKVMGEITPVPRIPLGALT